jgi:hypothetical protein
MLIKRLRTANCNLTAQKVTKLNPFPCVRQRRNPNCMQSKSHVVVQLEKILVVRWRLNCRELKKFIFTI